MRAEASHFVEQIEKSLALLRMHIDPKQSQEKLDQLNDKVKDPTLWDDPMAAQKTMRQRQKLESMLTGFVMLERDLADNIELIEMGELEGDKDIVLEAEQGLAALAAQAKKQEIDTLLSGEVDGNDCYLEIHAGAGGTESQDWAEMLLRMYMRWAEKRGFKPSVVEATAGEEAGLKAATLEIKGEDAFGWAKTETGVHRLVRISPFDSNSRRHTSFSSVQVYPVIDDAIEIDINEGDCRIDTYRASGAGGQHVNTTDSAVRITHNPTGIVVQCQSQRSQHKNKAAAWNMLRARLYDLEMQKRDEKASQDQQEKTSIGWGHKIRSYVLQPYQLVKDLRTGVESSNPDAVLDGDLDGFIAAALAHRVGGETSGVDDLE